MVQRAAYLARRRPGYAAERVQVPVADPREAPDEACHGAASDHGGSGGCQNEEEREQGDDEAGKIGQTEGEQRGQANEEGSALKDVQQCSTCWSNI